MNTHKHQLVGTDQPKTDNGLFLEFTRLLCMSMVDEDESVTLLENVFYD